MIFAWIRYFNDSFIDWNTFLHQPVWLPWGNISKAKDRINALFFAFFFFFFFFLFSASPGHKEFPGQGPDSTAAATALVLLTHCAGRRIEPASWCCRDSAHPLVPQQERLSLLFVPVVRVMLWFPSILQRKPVSFVLFWSCVFKCIWCILIQCS